jgi:hypothetical protein
VMATRAPGARPRQTSPTSLQRTKRRHDNSPASSVRGVSQRRCWKQSMAFRLVRHLFASRGKSPSPPKRGEGIIFCSARVALSGRADFFPKVARVKNTNALRKPKGKQRHAPALSVIVSARRAGGNPEGFVPAYCCVPVAPPSVDCFVATLLAMTGIFGVVR